MRTTAPAHKPDRGRFFVCPEPADPPQGIIPMDMAQGLKGNPNVRSFAGTLTGRFRLSMLQSGWEKINISAIPQEKYQ